MRKAQFYTAAAKSKGSVTLPAEFDGVVHKHALYQAVRAFRANQRQGTHATKTRAEVSGGSRKPWRQKGTGRARQGTTRAAQWKGGGVVFGPKPRQYRIDLPKKIRRLARQSALNQRANESALVVIEGLEFEVPKTRELARMLDKLGVGAGKVLMLTDGTKRNVVLSGRNLPRVSVMPFREVTAYDVLCADAIVIEQGALQAGGPSGKGGANA